MPRRRMEVLEVLVVVLVGTEQLSYSVQESRETYKN